MGVWAVWQRLTRLRSPQRGQLPTPSPESPAAADPPVKRRRDYEDKMLRPLQDYEDKSRRRECAS